jgi:hypothetical protein
MMDQYDTNAERKKSELQYLKLKANLSTFFAAATVCSSLYIVGSMEYGGTFNLSSDEHVTAIFAEAVKNDPKRDTPAFKARLQEKAKEAEKGIGLACTFFSVLSAVMMSVRDAKYKRALGPQPK